jgi:hypothetical protein
MSTRRSRKATIITALAFVAGALAVAACLGPPVTEQRQVGAFSAVSASNEIEVRVHVVAGASPAITVTAPEKVMDRVITTVEGDRLVLGISGSGSRSVEVDVTTAGLSAVNASSSSKVVVDGVTGGAFDAVVSSQAEVEVAGTTGNLRLDVSSQARAKLGQLAATTAQVNLSSQARGEIRVSDAVSGDVSSQAKLTILGSPVQVTVRTTSQGSVTRG